ncbi:MAG TPA: DUF1697 domain-containing protein [Pseudonocardiaceae bacterium]
MTRYAALLRGINLGSRNRVAMTDLRAIFTDLGHRDVVTHVQSGNVAFTSGGGTAADIERAVTGELAARLGHDVPVMVRSHAELGRLVDGVPYPVDDPLRTHVTLLAEAPDAELVAALTVPEGESARLTLRGRDVYLHTPDGYGRTKLSNAFLERRLKVAATTRNWRTVTTMHELTG